MSFLNEFTKATSQMRSSDNYFRWVGLSILASTLGRKTWLDFNNFTIYPNIYVLLVGSAALTNKSTAARYAQKLLKGVPRVNVLPENMTPAALLNRMAENSRTTHATVGTSSYPYGANLIYATEAINVLGRGKWGNMLDILTELYDNEPHGWHINEPWIKETVSGGQIKIYNPSINLLGCTTPEGLLSKIISKNELDSGFASRVFFVYEPTGSKKAHAWITGEEAEETEKTLAMLHNRLKEISNLNGAFKVSPAVISRHVQFMEENDEFIEKLNMPKLKSFYGRKGTHILKIAMCLSVSESDSMQVTMSHWQQAHDYVSELESKYKELFTGIGHSRYASVVHVLWQYIIKNDSFTFAELNAKFWEDFDTDTLHNGVKTLLTMKRIVLNEEKRFIPIDKSPLS